MIKSILNVINEDNGSNYKMDILKRNTHNPLFEKVLKMAYDKVVYTYGISMKNVTCDIGTANPTMTLQNAVDILESDFCTRKVTGHKAMAELEFILTSLSLDDADVITKIIGRDLKINMGRSNINKVFKNLIVKPPYMRCGIYGVKTAKKINFPAIVQLKADGMFQAVQVENGKVTFTSRAGEERQLPHLEKIFCNFKDGVYIGELLVKGIKDRSLANGRINSDDDKRDVYIQLWDYITPQEYANGKGKNTIKYVARFSDLKTEVDANPQALDSVIVIESYEVKTIQEALAYTSKWMNDGFEGAILKDYGNIFKDHTSPTQLKLKLEIDLEVRCTGFTDGKKGTKRAATFGAMTFVNDEGTIKGQTSGFTDAMILKLHNNREKYIGKVFTVQFNDLTQARDNDYYALSHPRFIEFRDDKDETDTLEKAFELREMAMELS